MNFKLKAELKLSKAVDADLKKLVETMNKEFKKTAKETPTQIVDLKHEGDKVELTIEGSSIPRPHDALIRFKKSLSEKLGKESKTGVREVIGKEYEIEFEAEKEAKEPIKILFVDKVEIDGKNVKMAIKDLTEEMLQKNYVDRMMKLVDEKIQDQYYEGREEYKELIWESGKKQISYNEDPSVEMEKLNWIKRTVGKGQFVYGREYTALANTMKELLKQEVYDKLGFYEMVFPKFEHWEIPKKSGHASHIYPIGYFVSVPKNSDPKSWEEVMDYYKITGEIDKKAVVEKSESVGMMSYAQCPPFWPYLEGRTIEEKSLPLNVYDWSGPTYRNESGGTHGIERVEEFHRIETLFVGTKDHVVETWKQISEAFKKFYSETLDLEIRIYDVAPWWMIHAGKTGAGTKEVGTVDIDIYLPYRGGRDAEWLEVQNASSIGNKYPKAFNVKGKKEEIWSGCCGASIQRIVVSFLAQKGFDASNWPDKVKNKFEENIKGIKELKFA